MAPSSTGGVAITRSPTVAPVTVPVKLVDAEVLRQRFEQDNQSRADLGLTIMPVDEYLLAALPQMPATSGIALGLDRLLMVVTQQSRLDKVITFPAHLA